MPSKDLYKSFLTTLRFENKSAETIRTYEKCLRKYREYLKETKQELGEDSMLDFLSDMSEREKLKPSTVKLYMIILKRFFRFIGEDFPKVKLPKIPKGRPKFIERDDFIRIYALTEGWYPLRPILSCAYSAAMRISEVTTRKYKDVDLRKRTLFVAGKTGPETDAKLPLDASATRDIELWLQFRRDNKMPDLKAEDYLFHRPNDQSKPYSKSTLNSQMYSLCEQVGIEHRSFHKVRHSRATHLREDGIDLVNIKDLLRHKSIMTTMVYASTDTEKLRKVLGDKDVLGKEVKK